MERRRGSIGIATAALGLLASCGNGTVGRPDAPDAEDAGEAETGAEAEASDADEDGVADEGGDDAGDDGGGETTSCLLSGAATEVLVEKAEEGGLCRLVVRRLAIVTPPRFEIDLDPSPIWQVDLRRRSLVGRPAVLTDFILVPDVGRDTADATADLRFPCERLRLVVSGDSSCRLEWIGLPLDAGAQTLDVTVDLSLRPDEMVEWNVGMSLTDGELFVHDVRFPYLATAGLGDIATDDRLVISWDGGYAIRNVLGRADGVTDAAGQPHFDNWDHVSVASVQNPGDKWLYGKKTATMQFLAYLDAADERFPGDLVGTPAGGLYMAAEDGNGYLKKIYGNRGAAVGSTSALRDLMVFYVRHYNSVRHAARVPDTADMFGFDLRGRFGYAVVTRPFRGDWVTAAEMYRAWATDEESAPLWLPDGTLAERRGRGELPDLAETFLGAIYKKGAELDASDQAVLESIPAFVQGDHSPAVPVATMVTSGNTYREFGISAADCCYTPNRTWAHDLARTVSERTGAVFYFNHDTGKAYMYPPNEHRGSLGSEVGYESTELCSGGSDPATWPADNDEIVLSGAVLGLDDSLHVMNEGDLQYAAHSEWWYRERTIRFAEDRLLETSTPDGRFGLRGVMLSGTGPVPVECWAPLFDEVDLARHDHPLGGGNHQSLAWRGVVEELRRFASGTTPENPHEIPGFFVLFERNSELLLDLADLTGNLAARTPQLVRTGPAAPYDLMPEARKIPLFDAVFRQHGRRGNAYEAGAEFLADFAAAGEDGHLQYQYTFGQLMVGFGEAWGLTVLPPSMSPVDRVTPDGVPPEWWAARTYARTLADVLYAGRDWSVYGRFLRPPRVTTPALASLTACQVTPSCDPGEYRTIRLPPVLASAFEAPDGSIGIFVTNWTDAESAADVVLDVGAGVPDGSPVCRLAFGAADERIGSVSAGAATIAAALPPRSAELAYVVPGEATCRDL